MAKTLRAPSQDNENNDDNKKLRDGDSDEGGNGQSEAPPLAENQYPYVEINAIIDT